MSNQPSIETQIIGLGLKAPSIKPEAVQAMVDRLSFHTYVIPGTTMTVAAAIDPLGFVVALGQTAIVSPPDFSESLGRNAAITKAKRAAFDELFKLESYRLKHNLYEAAQTGLLAELSLHLAADPTLSADPTLAPGLALGHTLVGGAAPVAPRRLLLGPPPGPPPSRVMNSRPSRVWLVASRVLTSFLKAPRPASPA